MGKKGVWTGLLVCAISVARPLPESIAETTPGSTERAREIETEEEYKPELEREVDAVVLVTLDGVRWQEVFEGTEAKLLERSGRAGEGMDAPHLWPNVYRMLHDRGVAFGGGAVSISATGPNYMSLPGYTEILTGHSPSSCGDNECAMTKESTLVDEVLDRGEDAAVVASWERLERAAARDARSAVITAGRHGGIKLPNGAIAKKALSYRKSGPGPGVDDFRQDRQTAELALMVLRERRPAFTMIALGEPDEYAHHDDYPGYLRSLRECDAFLAELMSTLEGLGRWGARTAVFVTTDHGRGWDFKNHGGPYPESGRTWLLAFGAGIHARGVTQLESPRHLADIAPTIRELLGLQADPHALAGRPIHEIRSPLLAAMP